MSSDKFTCPDCGHENDYSEVRCRCTRFLGFPNRRIAEEQAADLDIRYSSAVTQAAARGVAPLLIELERLAMTSTPVICLSVEAADDITRAGKYRNYHTLVDQGQRDIASRIDDSDRTMVGSRLYPGFFQKIHYAALSPNGRGLSSYGDVAISWYVSAEYLEKRVSVHEENSYVFFDRHSLGNLGTPVPAGYVGSWNDRNKVAVAKLERKLTTAMGTASLESLLLDDSMSRAADDFVEIAIYADEGIDSLDINRVTVQNPPTDRDKQRRLDLVEGACISRGIDYVA